MRNVVFNTPTLFRIEEVVGGSVHYENGRMFINEKSKARELAVANLYELLIKGLISEGFIVKTPFRNYGNGNRGEVLLFYSYGHHIRGINLSITTNTTTDFERFINIVSDTLSIDDIVDNEAQRLIKFLSAVRFSEGVINATLRVSYARNKKAWQIIVDSFKVSSRDGWSIMRKADYLTVVNFNGELASKLSDTYATNFYDLGIKDIIDFGDSKGIRTYLEVNLVTDYEVEKFGFSNGRTEVRITSPFLFSHELGNEVIEFLRRISNKLQGSIIEVDDPSNFGIIEALPRLMHSTIGYTSDGELRIKTRDYRLVITNVATGYSDSISVFLEISKAGASVDEIAIIVRKLIEEGYIEVGNWLIETIKSKRFREILSFLALPNVSSINLWASFDGSYEPSDSIEIEMNGGGKVEIDGIKDYDSREVLFELINGYASDSFTSILINTNIPRKQYEFREFDYIVVASEKDVDLGNAIIVKDNDKLATIVFAGDG